jgi:hypothetical protein
MQPKLSKEQIEGILGRIKFQDRTFRLLEKGDGFLLQMQYMEPDVNIPGSEPVLQSTRKWYISPYMSPTEIVETAWACVCRSQMHVASEHFTYKGHRVYSQHFDLAGRMSLCEEGWFDGREPIQKE